MINRQMLKESARQRMRGRHPNTYIVSAVYIATAGVLAAFIYALSQYDRVALFILNTLSVNPYPTLDELAAVLPPLQPMAVVLIISILIVKRLMAVGYMAYCLKVSRSEEADTRTVFDSFTMFFKILRLDILRFVIVGLWSLLFIFPGVIAYYSYRQSFYILMDKPDFGPLDCMRESKRMMTGNRLELFFLDFSFLGWNFIDRVVEYATSLRLFSLWLAPYVGVARAGFYDRLAAGPEPSEPA